MDLSNKLLFVRIFQKSPNSGQAQLFQQIELPQMQSPPFFLWSIRDFEEQIWHKQCDTGSRGWLFYTGNGTIVEQNTELLRFMTIAEVDNQIAHDWERIKQTTSETVRRIELLNFTRVHPLTFVPYIEWRKKDLTKQRAENLEKGLSKGIAKTKLAELVETLTLDDQLREEEENRARTA